MSFLHDMSNKIIPTNKSTLTIPCNAIPDIAVPTETGDKLTPTQGRDFPGFLTGMHCKAHEDDYQHMYVYFQ